MINCFRFMLFQSQARMPSKERIAESKNWFLIGCLLLQLSDVVVSWESLRVKYTKCANCDFFNKNELSHVYQSPSCDVKSSCAEMNRSCCVMSLVLRRKGPRV